MREAAFRRAIADPAAAPPHPRFGVYRNNVASALINALRVRYPVLENAMGAPAFAAAAGRYIERHLPESAVLIAYGENFADFVEGPLADLARLESLWWKAYHAGEAQPLEPADFAALAPDQLAAARFEFHPSAGLLASPWAVGSQWQSGQGRAAAQPECVLVWRPQAEVRVHVIDRDTHDFLAALMHGGNLLAAGQEFDMQAQLRQLIASRLVTGICKGE